MTEERKRKPGPDPLPPEAQRRRRISIYVTDGEYFDLLKKAGGVKRHIAVYCRNAALGQPQYEIPAVNRALWAELARTTANLNQLQKAINEGRVPSTAAIERVLSELQEQVAKLRLELIGGLPEDDDDESDG